MMSIKAFVKKLVCGNDFPVETLVQPNCLFPTHSDVAPVRPLSEVDLVKVDLTYATMYGLHSHCHVGLANEIAELRGSENLSPKMLEIASGSGWNSTKFILAGFDYYALDLCEPALVVLMRRHPEAKFLNIDIADSALISDNAFDVVFSSSMLEHLENYARALTDMVRISRSHLFVTFFEGLLDGEEDKIVQHEYIEDNYSFYGRKWADLQKSYNNTFFWNRYSRKTIEQIVKDAGAKNIEFLTSENRSYLKGETILHVTK